ncbi:hypothetical protein chiPu_0024930, partial [Chiloscyllium punctatum]|nr:hypothetical protein [Chiloscyllium punctatum]
MDLGLGAGERSGKTISESRDQSVHRVLLPMRGIHFPGKRERWRGRGLDG